MKYQVIDRQTRVVVGTFSVFIKAHHAAQRKDLAYGSARYMVRSVKVV